MRSHPLRQLLLLALVFAALLWPVTRLTRQLAPAPDPAPAVAASPSEQRSKGAAP